jgi:hypothetical protein
MQKPADVDIDRRNLSAIVSSKISAAGLAYASRKRGAGLLD